MRRAVVMAILAACAIGIAVPAFGQGKPEKTGTGCRPAVTVVLKGTMAASPSANATSVLVTATKANHHGAPYLKLGQPLQIQVDANTKVRRQGRKTLADLKQGDPVKVHAKACKADLKTGTPVLTARMIVAHDPSQAKDDDENKAGDKSKGHNGKGDDDKDNDADD
jgi:hypothetical protein